MESTRIREKGKTFNDLEVVKGEERHEEAKAKGREGWKKGRQGRRYKDKGEKMSKRKKMKGLEIVGEKKTMWKRRKEKRKGREERRTRGVGKKR